MTPYVGLEVLAWQAALLARYAVELSIGLRHENVYSPSTVRPSIQFTDDDNDVAT